MPFSLPSMGSFLATYHNYGYSTIFPMTLVPLPPSHGTILSIPVASAAIHVADEGEIPKIPLFSSRQRTQETIPPLLPTCAKMNTSYPQTSTRPSILHAMKEIIIHPRKTNIIPRPPGSLTHNHSPSTNHLNLTSKIPAKLIHFSPPLQPEFGQHHAVFFPSALSYSNPFTTLQPELAF